MFKQCTYFSCAYNSNLYWKVEFQIQIDSFQRFFGVEISIKFHASVFKPHSNLLLALFCICLRQYWVKFICVKPWWPISFERLKEKLIAWNTLQVCECVKVAAIHIVCVQCILCRLHIANKSRQPSVNSDRMRKKTNEWKKCSDVEQKTAIKPYARTQRLLADCIRGKRKNERWYWSNSVAYVHVYRTQSKTAAKCIWLWQMRLSCIWLKVSSFLLVDVKFDNLTSKLLQSNIKI